MFKVTDLAFMQITHQIQVLAEPLCRAQGMQHNEWGTN